jgi:hypothetical protein
VHVICNIDEYTGEGGTQVGAQRWLDSYRWLCCALFEDFQMPISVVRGSGTPHGTWLAGLLPTACCALACRCTLVNPVRGPRQCQSFGHANGYSHVLYDRAGTTCLTACFVPSPVFGSAVWSVSRQAFPMKCLQPFAPVGSLRDAVY